MGTNYDWYESDANTWFGPKTDPCPHCHRPYEPDKGIHIGKSSAGWTFSLHIYPEKGIYNLEDWVERFNRPGSVILDEYGSTVDSKKMLSIITERSSRGQLPTRYEYPAGPNGLLRCKIDGYHCIAHGPGTWDLCVGEFS